MPASNGIPTGRPPSVDTRSTTIRSARFPDWLGVTPSERDIERNHCRERLLVLGPRLNATVAKTLERHLTQSAGSRLEGLPYVAKDMFDRTERRATWGGVRPDGPPPAQDAAVLARLDAAGACQLAVSSMTELAYEPSGYNRVHGRALNPWDPEAVTGGSSSGSAALVAAGAAFLGVGSDTGGSVRIPASCCGVTGLKPSIGAVAVGGAMALAPSLDTIGFFARSARDLTLVWPSVADETADAPNAPLSRVVVVEDCVHEAAPAVHRAITAGIEAIHACGLVFERMPLRPLIEEADRHALVVMQAESARVHQPENFAAGRLDPVLCRRLAKGLDISDAALAASLAERSRLRSAFLDALGPAEIAILPVMPCETPLAAECDPQSPSFSPRTLYRVSSFTRFVNFLGLPALSIPCGFDGRGVPIGLQIIGRPHEEIRLLCLAERVQNITDWHGRVPPAATTAP